MADTRCGHGRANHGYRCKECGGKGICPCNKVRTQCKKCNPAGFCRHDRKEAQCVDCDGSQICACKKQKAKCPIHGGSALCEHLIQRAFCTICGGSQICKHLKHLSQCEECGGSSLCECGHQRANCKKCKGSNICDHGEYKSLCIECKHLCTSQLCKLYLCHHSKSRNKELEGFCTGCFCKTYPGSPYARNYKTKEKEVVNNIKLKFDEFDWIHDKIIKDGCSKRRPDMFLDLLTHVIVVEIDEYGHSRHEEICENKRLMQISEDIGHRPLVMIRFNPDGYTDSKNEYHKSCFLQGKDGVFRVPRNKTREWRIRINKLLKLISWWAAEIPEKTITPENLYMNSYPDEEDEGEYEDIIEEYDYEPIFDDRF